MKHCLLLLVVTMFIAGCNGYTGRYISGVYTPLHAAWSISTTNAVDYAENDLTGKCFRTKFSASQMGRFDLHCGPIRRNPQPSDVLFGRHFYDMPYCYYFDTNGVVYLKHMSLLQSATNISFQGTALSEQFRKDSYVGRYHRSGDAYSVEFAMLCFAFGGNPFSSFAGGYWLQRVKRDDEALTIEPVSIRLWNKTIYCDPVTNYATRILSPAELRRPSTTKQAVEMGD